MARAIDKYFCTEKLVKANDVVWFFSSDCNLRSHWEECVGRVNRTFCFTIFAIDVLQGSIVQRPISALIIRDPSFFVRKRFFG